VTALEPGRAGVLAGRAGRPVAAVLLPWAVARVIVLAALAFSHLVVSRTHPGRAGVVARVHQGLLGWDAGWYEGIAKHGYAALGRESLRFFPAVPLGARFLGAFPGVGAGPALIVLANVSALVATALLFVLVRRETGDERQARRSAWLLSLAPPAFVLVMGYAEATLLALSVGCFLALRPARGRHPAWWWAAGTAFLAALTRPIGVLLVLPIALEAVRWWDRERRGRRTALVGALLAPVAGLATFLGWVGATFGDVFLPLRLQQASSRHGGVADPFTTLYHDARGALHHHFGTALHVPWVFVVVGLLVVCWWRWPASYGLFATAVVLVAVSGTNLDSFERYSLSAFPLVLAAGTLTGSTRVERTVLTLSAAGLAGYSLLAFLNLSVP
jgi:hypothetical protein